MFLILFAFGFEVKVTTAKVTTAKVTTGDESLDAEMKLLDPNVLVKNLTPAMPACNDSVSSIEKENCPEYIIQFYKKYPDPNQCDHKVGRYWVEPTLFEKDLSQRLNVGYDKNKSSLTSELNGCITSKKTLTYTDRKKILSDVYVLKSRMQEALISNIRNIVAIEQGLGKQALSGLKNCADLHENKAKHWCNELKGKCQAEASENQLENESEFQAVLAVLYQNLTDLNEASECIEKKSAAQRCLKNIKKVEAIFASLPPFRKLEPKNNTPKEKELAAQYNMFFQGSECRRDYFAAKAAFDDVWQPPLTMLAFTAATGGTGALAAAGLSARAGTTLANAGRAANAANKAIQIGFTASSAYDVYKNCYENSSAISVLETQEVLGFLNKKPACPSNQDNQKLPEFSSQSNILGCSLSIAFTALGAASIRATLNKGPGIKTPPKNLSQTKTESMTFSLLNESPSLKDWFKQLKASEGLTKADRKIIMDVRQKEVEERAAAALGKPIAGILGSPEKNLAKNIVKNEGDLLKSLSFLEKNYKPAEIYRLIDEGVFGKVTPNELSQIALKIGTRSNIKATTLKDAREFQPSDKLAQGMSEAQLKIKQAKIPLKPAESEPIHRLSGNMLSKLNEGTEKRLGELGLKFEKVQSDEILSYMNQNRVLNNEFKLGMSYVYQLKQAPMNGLHGSLGGPALQHKMLQTVLDRAKEAGIKIVIDPSLNLATPPLTSSLQFTNQSIAITSRTTYQELLSQLSQLKTQKEIFSKINMDSLLALSQQTKTEKLVNFIRGKKGPDEWVLKAQKTLKQKGLSSEKALRVDLSINEEMALLKDLGIKKMDPILLMAKDRLYTNTIESLSKLPKNARTKEQNKALKKAKRWSFINKAILNLKGISGNKREIFYSEESGYVLEKVGNSWKTLLKEDNILLPEI